MTDEEKQAEFEREQFLAGMYGMVMSNLNGCYPFKLFR